MRLYVVYQTLNIIFSVVPNNLYHFYMRFEVTYCDSHCEKFVWIFSSACLDGNSNVSFSCILQLFTRFNLMLVDKVFGVIIRFSSMMT
jgi:hypothetical protein